jgi:hypothetical protein
MAIRRFFVSLVTHKHQVDLVTTDSLLQARRDALRVASVLPLVNDEPSKSDCFVGIMRVNHPGVPPTPFSMFVHLAEGIGEWHDVDRFLELASPAKVHKKRHVKLAPEVLQEISLALSTLARVVRSMAEAARACAVSIVTGDTKVVERGKGDAVFVTTTGIGTIVSETPIVPAAVQVGDAVIVSGPVGDHGTAVMLAREGLPIPDGLVSDSASVADAVLALFARGARSCRDDDSNTTVTPRIHEASDSVLPLGLPSCNRNKGCGPTRCRSCHASESPRRTERGSDETRLRSAPVSGPPIPAGRSGRDRMG